MLSTHRFSIPKTIIAAMESFYGLRAQLADGNRFEFETLRGRKVLIVNTASECGCTPQLAQLQELHLKYGNKIAVLAFPCNQFGGQEPGTDQEVLAFCSREYGVTFRVMSKCDVRGKHIHAVWKWLTTRELNGVGDSEVKWNFQKYAVSEAGMLEADFSHRTDPLDASIVQWILQSTLF